MGTAVSSVLHPEAAVIPQQRHRPFGVVVRIEPFMGQPQPSVDTSWTAERFVRQRFDSEWPLRRGDRGAGCGDRTRYIWFTKPVLYQMS